MAGPQISKLLNTYEEEESKDSLSHEEYLERVMEAQIIRGWNAYVEGDSEESHGFKRGTKFVPPFRKGYKQASLFHRGIKKPNISSNLRHERIPACKRTISECMELLEGG